MTPTRKTKEELFRELLEEASGFSFRDTFYNFEIELKNNNEIKNVSVNDLFYNVNKIKITKEVLKSLDIKEMRKSLNVLIQYSPNLKSIEFRISEDEMLSILDDENMVNSIQSLQVYFKGELLEDCFTIKEMENTIYLKDIYVSKIKSVLEVRINEVQKMITILEQQLRDSKSEIGMNEIKQMMFILNKRINELKHLS